MKLTTYFGKPVEGSYQRYLDGIKDPVQGNTIPPQGINSGDYIFMPQHNLYVAKERTHFNEDWYKSHEALHSEGARMLTLREFADFLILLRSGNDEFQKIYKAITEARKPWRAEWLDADFKVINNSDTLHINYNHRTINSKLKPQNSESLESCLMEDCGVDLTSFNRQGLPTRKGNDFNYWFPRKGAVAGFFALSDGASLYCGRGPRNSYSVLGVRSAREKK